MGKGAIIFIANGKPLYNLKCINLTLKYKAIPWNIIL